MTTVSTASAEPRKEPPGVTFALIDAPLGRLQPGQCFAVDGEAVRYGQVPAELLDFDSVPKSDPTEFTAPS